MLSLYNYSPVSSHHHFPKGITRGDGVAPLVEPRRRIQDTKIGGSNPVCLRSTRKKIVITFPSQKKMLC